MTRCRRRVSIQRHIE